MQSLSASFPKTERTLPATFTLLSASFRRKDHSKKKELVEEMHLGSGGVSSGSIVATLSSTIF